MEAGKFFNIMGDQNPMVGDDAGCDDKVVRPDANTFSLEIETDVGVSERALITERNDFKGREKLFNNF